MLKNSQYYKEMEKMIPGSVPLSGSTPTVNGVLCHGGKETILRFKTLSMQCKIAVISEGNVQTVFFSYNAIQKGDRVGITFRIKSVKICSGSCSPAHSAS